MQRNPSSSFYLLLRNWLGIVALCALQACVEPPADLPEIPALAIDAFSPRIRQQLETARAAVAQDPENALVNGRLGMTLHAYQLYAAAEVCYRRARALDRDSFRWAYYHADVLGVLGRNDEAIAALYDSIRLRADYPAAQARLGGLLISDGSYADSEILLNQVLDQYPGHAEALYELGRLRLRAGRPEEGVAAMQQSIAVSGPNAGAYFALAEAHRKLGQTDLATRFYGLYHQYQQQPPTKRDPLLGEIALFNQSVTATVNRARRAYMEGKRDEAIAALEDALAQEPENVPALTALVGMHAQTGEFARADAYYAKALALAPNTAQLHINLAGARIAARRWDAAAESLRRALIIDPNNAWAHTQLASVLNTQGQPDAAITQFRLALEHDPAQQSARKGLADALVAAGREAEALTLMELNPRGDQAGPPASAEAN